MYVWYGTNFVEMNRLLNLVNPKDEELDGPGQSFKTGDQFEGCSSPAILTISSKDAGNWLILCDSYIRLLAQNGIISRSP